MYIKLKNHTLLANGKKSPNEEEKSFIAEDALLSAEHHISSKKKEFS